MRTRLSAFPGSHVGLLPFHRQCQLGRPTVRPVGGDWVACILASPGYDEAAADDIYVTECGTLQNEKGTWCYLDTALEDLSAGNYCFKFEYHR